MMSELAIHELRSRLNLQLQRFTLGWHTQGEPPLPPPPKGGDMDARFVPPFRRGGQGGCFRIDCAACATHE
jgi:hypothetical protein